MGRFTIQYAVRSEAGVVKQVGKVGVIDEDSRDNNIDPPVKEKKPADSRNAA